ncbi:phospholipase D family protein [Pseudidiomarina sp. PP-1MA]|uniref:Phospholipase D family protein n=1 Tax=Pseudidiomarina sp. PP-1MA TaxID=3237706 RepID=A0AB39X7D9_9GAMM
MTMFRVFLLSLLLFCCAACTGLPDLTQREASYAFNLAQTQHSRLGQRILPVLEEHLATSSPQQSAVVMLADAEQALATRLLLTAQADVSLDLQYYIWRNDSSGQQLLEAIYAAAERGVRVRLLMDDLHSRDADVWFAYLNQHPNIQVRLFNPFIPRFSRALGFMFDFSRANRRMHNKSFTVDNLATIVGGRNIGNDYFDRTDGFYFADLDVLAMGPVVNAVSDDFDEYWNSDSAYPYELLHSPANNPRQGPPNNDLADLVTPQQVSLDKLIQAKRWQWANVAMISDSPNKGLGTAAPEELITDALARAIGSPERQLLLVSPYFVPTAAGVDALATIAAQGVEVKVLTNAFATTDVAIVHSGYAKRRRALLEAGIQLFEMRPNNGSSDPTKTGAFSSSASSLHAKTFAVDQYRIFVGSFNFDPRSARLNTELGFIIDNQHLATQLAETFTNNVPYSSYQVLLDEDGHMYWLERRPEGTIRHDQEPQTSWFQRFASGFFGLLPIDWLL